ncbi:actin cytoskeleton-regulatory complex protein PAN1 [Emergomyces africanus]|uniref:DNA mismatch repair protein MSH5 n=1 Tax=Emergomyces africanus TaxID=1955775 RepID=A0A1B7NSP8_9EURO|nr:actin cytoskeleton-regulatory complex protein PAN1 [Emergomyces africanus]
MYSNTFYGGNGQPPFGQQPNPQPQQQSQQQPFPGFSQQPQQQNLQPGTFMSQPTGFAGSNQMQQLQMPMQQPQPTGFPPAAGLQQQQQQQQQPPQPQFTGFPPQNQQQPLTTATTPQQQQQQLSAPSSIPPHQTGMTSAQIAQSFAQSATPGAPAQHASAGSKIPNMRLSFITAQDQAKFEQLFKSAVGNNQSLDGETAKDLLMRSKLPGSDLSKIWVLSDTTKSGRLLFPEFALAMYLCNLRLTGKDLPSALPERISNEVSSMANPTRPPTNVPKFDAPLMQNTSAPPAPQQPQPQQASNTQLLSQLTSQPTGFYNQATTGLQPPTIVQPQQTGFPGQNAGLRPQQSSFLNNPQPTGYTGPRPPMPPMPSGYGSNLSPSQTGLAPLNAQPTGVPGQWGFVNAPATGLPNIEALQKRLMPQQGREGGFTTQGLSGNATIPWAVTKDEKKIYDQLFKAWDGFNKGFIGGDVAIEIMGQSGLERQDLERIWTLSDPNNRGRLNMDEFAVAMHLIYRKLNGYPVPNRLPPELIPPSTRNFNDSIGTVKSLLSQDAESRKSSGAFLQPQRTGVSYLKNHSFRSGSTSPGVGRKDATVFKNNDDAIGYRSSARRRVGGGGTPSPTPSPLSERSDDEASIEQLKKKIREAKIMLDATDFQDQNRAEEEETLNRRDRREAESLMERIRRVQDDIDTDPKAAFRNTDSGAERRALRRQLQSFQDQLPELASSVRKIERNIADARLELFRLKDAKAHPSAAAAIVGTGPGGAVTESDRIKARARARMQARAAELAGRPPPSTDDDGAAARRLEEETASVKAERERNDAMTREVEESVKEFTRSLEDSLKDVDENSTREHERRRWEEALGVEDTIKDFIYDLQRGSRTAKVRKEENAPASRSLPNNQYDDSPANGNALPVRPSPPQSTGSASSLAGLTHQERVASAKERAQKRIAERMAAAGLKPSSDGGAETVLERQEREKREREERRKRAEEEDAKRELERQRRIAEEQNGPPVKAVPTNKKPPPPPSRKGKADGGGVAETRKSGDVDKAAKGSADHEGREQALREEQQAQEAESRRLEAEARQQEEELAREREAAQARLKALEEQVKQGKIKKQEEKRRRQLAEKEAKEKEARLAAQRAEIEAAQARERELQRQLEGLDNEESSDDEGLVDITPQNSTPTQSAFFPSASTTTAPPPPVPRPATPPAAPFEPEPEPEPEHEVPAAAAASPAFSGPESIKQRSAADTESKNPYFRKFSQSADTQPQPPSFHTPPEQIPDPLATVETATAPPKSEVQSTNPFHRLAQQQESQKSAFTAAPLPGPLERKSRARPEDDEWSVAGSENSSDDDDDRPAGGSAKHLASILFGTMGPPRPLSAMDEKPESKPATPVQTGPVPTASPPPPSPPPPPPAVAEPPPAQAVEDMDKDDDDDDDENDFQDAPSMPPPPPPPPPPSAAPFGAPTAPPSILPCHSTREVWRLQWRGGTVGSEKEIEIVYEMAQKILQYEKLLVEASDICGEIDRHLLHEVTVPTYIPNDTLIVGGNGRDGSHPSPTSQPLETSVEVAEVQGPSMLLLTGPNYSGKSVYLKQLIALWVALIVYMAHIGSFVPAESAKIGITDKILTRITTRETVSKARAYICSFMIDLQQISFALTLATERSLVIIDEFGKGTESTDGAGLACGLFEYLLSLGEKRPKVLAATHFHEIFENGYLAPRDELGFGYMEVQVDMAARDVENQVTYLYNFRSGRSNASFGTNCAALNGIDPAIISRANEIGTLAARGEDLVVICAKMSVSEMDELEEAESMARRFLGTNFSLGPKHAGIRSENDERPEMLLENIIGESNASTVMTGLT